MKRWLKWTYWTGGGIAALLVVFIAVTGDPFLTLAFLTAERRPSLLSDAGWEDPASAKAFGQRFAAGTPEVDLLSWLKAEDFEIDAARRTARRLIRGLPCNEGIDIAWTVDSPQRLETAVVTVQEAGCL